MTAMNEPEHWNGFVPPHCNSPGPRVHITERNARRVLSKVTRGKTAEEALDEIDKEEAK